MAGLVHVYFGDGKGKTTAAFGLVLRALGRGKRVLIVQFMKLPQDQFAQYGEVVSLSKLDNVLIKQFGLREWVFFGKPSTGALSEAREAFDFLFKRVFSQEFDLVIADELLYCIQLGLMSEEEVVGLIKSKPSSVELVLTGAQVVFPNIIFLADYVTEFKKLKHPFDKGFLARESIEY